MALFSSKTLTLLLLHPLLPILAHAAEFDITNSCSYTVWAAAIPGGGQQLDPEQTWSFHVEPGTANGLIWGRTNCTFDPSGRGQCETGDCAGLFACQVAGSPPNTVAEYSLTQFKNLDWYDISLVGGFNVPMEFVPENSSSCHDIRCSANVTAECPEQLRAPGGCNNPCTVYKTEEYCCSSSDVVCSPSEHSKFFKNLCPDVYTYPRDDATALFTCPGVLRYKVVFCP